jgi:3-oxoacyl-[acyl-carrier-protein] synthase III
MRLSGIDCQIPSNKIVNEEIIELVKFYSTEKYNGSIKDLEELLRRFIKITGINSRFWRSKNEKPIDLLITSVDRSLKMAGLHRNDIDLVIYSSIDRGFLEPANASFVCKAIGLNNTRCFDISDGCMGWGSAVQTANSFLCSYSEIETVLIINSEFPMDCPGSVLPKNFTINTISELDWKAPSFTLGEAVSSCIFQKGDYETWKYNFVEASDQAHLCTIQLFNFQNYLTEIKNVNGSSDLQFYSLGNDLLKFGFEPAIKVLNDFLKDLKYIPRVIFPHSISSKVIQEAAIKASIEFPVCSTFSELGNIATASIPSAISKAILNNTFTKGQKGVAWIASAGMKFAAFEIQIQ